jgi:hypothetical protein
MNIKLDFASIGLLSHLVIAACISFPAYAQSIDDDPIDSMQKVIEQQRGELDAQSQKLKSQQQQLDEQQKMLDTLQSDLKALAEERALGREGRDQAGEIVFSEENGDETSDGLLSEVTASADGAGASKASDSDRVAVQSHASINDHHLALDTHPLDVPDETGLFIYSNDGNKVFRMYGSIRALATYDNRQNFHPYDLNIPQVPFGDDDVEDWNQEWTMNTSKVGFQVGLKDYFTLLSEFDWKGESGDALRIRHMYMRTAHWLVGRHWTAFNTVNFLPLSIDSHSTSAHLGVRPTQIKYLGGNGNWSYQAALDYYQPKFDEPESLDATARNSLPNLVGNVSYGGSWGLFRVAAMLSPNRISYVEENNTRTTSSDAGFALFSGIKVSVNENNMIKAHIQRTNGNSQYGADYGFGNYDMVFNLDTGEFENLEAWGAQLALEHRWAPSLTTTIGGGYMSMDTKSFQSGDAFDHGYKALVNLFYRTTGRFRGLTLAAELEFAGQTTQDGSNGDTTRISALMYYDF